MNGAEHIAGRIRRGESPDVAAVGRVATVDAVRLGSRGAEEARAALAAKVLGFGPLEGLVADRSVTDVLVNGDGSVWVDRGAGVEAAGVDLADAAAARRLGVRLAALAGRRLDESQPWVDGLLPGGAGCTPSSRRWWRAGSTSASASRVRGPTGWPRCGPRGCSTTRWRSCCAHWSPVGGPSS
ncbi:hypothetical protein ASC58_18105 [Phycicoccus sp. Root101]|nr:hypothetical protein ASC58_18105 [Phycicoccus sp. Root101]